MTLQNVLQDRMDVTSARMSRIEVDGGVYWAKRREILSKRMRLQKGDPGKAFDRERRAFTELSHQRLPVPEIVAEGSDWFAIADHGRTLKEVGLDLNVTLADRKAAFAAAGAGLAQMHKAGFSHGRPAIRDILWDGQGAVFIDFERYAQHRNTTTGHAMDLILFVHSALSVFQKATPELDGAVDAYLADAPLDVITKAKRRCARLNWVRWLVAPVKFRPAGKSKDIRAVPMTLSYFAAL